MKLEIEITDQEIRDELILAIRRELAEGMVYHLAAIAVKRRASELVEEQVNKIFDEQRHELLVSAVEMAVRDEIREKYLKRLSREMKKLETLEKLEDGNEDRVNNSRKITKRKAGQE